MTEWHKSQIILNGKRIRYECFNILLRTADTEFIFYIRSILEIVKNSIIKKAFRCRINPLKTMRL